MSIKVTKGVPPEIANNYFALNEVTRHFGSGRTEAEARYNLAIGMAIADLKEREDRPVAEDDDNE